MGVKTLKPALIKNKNAPALPEKTGIAGALLLVSMGVKLNRQ